MTADSLTECVDECAAFPGCVAATFLAGSCYLKNGNTNIIYNNDVDSKSWRFWQVVAMTDT